MHYIGIDLGGTNIAAGLVSEKGKILHKESVPTRNERHQNEIMKDMTNLCLKLIKDFGINKEQIGYIGIGTPGVVDDKQGLIVYASNIRFENAAVREKMQKTFSMPIYLENDANCAALGESISGAAKGYNSSVTVTLGTGIGGGVVLDGKIFHGAFGQAGEVGHHVLNFDGPDCPCGRKGCWEVYSSATALVKLTREFVVANPNSAIALYVKGDIGRVNAKTVFDVADRGDIEAKNILEKYFTHLGIGVVNVINIFQPDIVVIGGGICGQGEKIITPIIKHAEKHVFGQKLLTDIAIAKLGNDAGIIGAAMIGAAMIGLSNNL